MRDDTYDTVEMLKRLGRQVSRLSRSRGTGDTPSIILDVSDTEQSSDSVPTETLAASSGWSWSSDAWGMNSW